MPGSTLEVANVRIIWKKPVDSGAVTESDFEVEKKLTVFKLENDQILCKTMFLSVDPYMRGRMKSKALYFPCYEAGKPLDGYGIAKVVGSCNATFKEGDIFVSAIAWEKYFVAGPKEISEFKKIDTSVGLPLPEYINALGLAGISAYAPLIKIAKPKAGEIAYISGASGSVGMIAGQLLKNVYKCRVVGSAGTDEKVAKLVNEFGFDAAFNYRTQDVNDALKQHCPEGIDIYFDNVGGPTLEAAIENCRDHARIVECGQISQYDNESHGYGVRNMVQVVFKRLHIQGFIVVDWMQELMPIFYQEMPVWLKEGKVKTTQTITHGIENMGKAFVDMMKGGNIGKALVQVEDE